MGEIFSLKIISEKLGEIMPELRCNIEKLKSEDLTLQQKNTILNILLNSISEIESVGILSGDSIEKINNLEEFEKLLKTIVQLDENDLNHLFKLIKMSITYLGKYLNMDYVGLISEKKGEFIKTYEYGSEVDLKNDVLLGQINAAKEDFLKDNNCQIHLCPSETEDGGVDAVLILSNTKKEIVGYLLLDDFDEVRELKQEEMIIYCNSFVENIQKLIVEYELLVIQDELEKAKFDKMTGLYDGEYGFIETINLIKKLRRFNNNNLTILTFDIDHFKSVNDTFGHGVGDDVLIGLTKMFSEGYNDGEDSYSPRDTDIFIRNGGEEFVFFLGGTDEKGAVELAKKIGKILSKMIFRAKGKTSKQYHKGGEFFDHKTGDILFSKTISIGIYQIPKDEIFGLRSQDDFKTYLEIADKNLYNAKNSGRNSIATAGNFVSLVKNLESDFKLEIEQSNLYNNSLNKLFKYQHVIRSILKSSWSEKTIVGGESFDIDNPSKGQCAVTALLIQNLFGGEILWSEARLPDGTIESHYFNLIEDVEVDFTRDQFPEGTEIGRGGIRKEGIISNKHYLLTEPNTKQRYEKLLELFIQYFDL